MLSLDEVRSLHNVIGLVAIVPLEDGSLSVEGPTPEWLRRLGGGELNDPEHAAYTLVESFMPDAEAFWEERRHGRLRSGIFTVTDADGKECHFEMSALSIGTRNVLVLEHLTQDYAETQAIFQKAREGFLLYKKSIQTETSLRLARQAAEATTERTSETLANWCEEMRRPVNAVIGSSEVLLEQQLTGPQRDMVGVIRRSADALLGMIDNVVDFSRSRGENGQTS
jgi:signal transduction histidine kinase